MMADKALRGLLTVSFVLYTVTFPAFGLPRSFESLDTFWNSALRSPPVDAYKQGLQKEVLFQDDTDNLPADIEAQLSAREIAVNLYVNRAADYQEVVPPEEAPEDERRDSFSKAQEHVEVLFKRYTAAHVELFLLNIVRASQSSERSNKCDYLHAAEASFASIATSFEDASVLSAKLPEPWQPLAKIAFEARLAHKDTLKAKPFCEQAERVDRNAAIKIIQRTANTEIITEIEKEVTGDNGLVKGVIKTQSGLDSLQDRVEGIDPKAGLLSSLHRDMANRLGNLEFVSSDALGLAEDVVELESLDFAAMIEAQASVPRDPDGSINFTLLDNLQPLVDVQTALDETFKSMKLLLEQLGDVANIPPSDDDYNRKLLAVCKNLPNDLEKLRLASTGDRDEMAEALRRGFNSCVESIEKYVTTFDTSGDISLNLYGGLFAEELRKLSKVIISLDEQE